MREERFATTLIASQDTIEDYTQTMISPLATQVEGRFAVVQDPSKAEAEREPEVLSVDPQGQLVHYRHDAASESGWVCEAVPVPGAPGPIERITAFYRPNGALNVFLQFGLEEELEEDETTAALVAEAVATIVMMRSPEGVWARYEPQGLLANILGRVQQLGIHLDPSGGRLLFGITRSFQPASFFILREEGEGWAPLMLQRVQQGDTAYYLLAGYDAGGLMVVRCNARRLYYRPGRHEGNRFRYSEPEDYITIRSPHLPAEPVLPFPARTAGGGEVHFLLTSFVERGKPQKHLDQLILPRAGDPQMILLSGGEGKPDQIKQVALSVDGDARYTALLLDDRNSLWLIRQTETDENIRFQRRWFHQGDELRVIGSPMTLFRGPEFFGVDTKHHLVHTQQPLIGEADAWHTRRLATPTPSTKKPARATTHTLQLHCQDANGLEVAGTTVFLTSDRHTTVHANGFAYTLGPAHEVGVQADASGRVTVRALTGRAADPDASQAPVLESSDLTAPRITAILRPPRERDPIRHTFAPDLSFYKRMADGRHMTGARIRGSALVDPARIDEGTADALAAVCRQAAKNRLAQDEAQDEIAALLCADMTTERWTLTFPEGGGIGVAPTSEEDFEAAWAAQAAAPDADLGRSFGDFIRWVKNTAKAFARALVEISRNAFKLIVEGVGTFVLKIGKQVGQFLEGLFKRLGEAFNKVVDAAGQLLSMFEALFHWEDILVTKRVLHAGFDGLLNALAASFKGDIPAYLEQRFEKARAIVADGFDDARKHLEGKNMVGLVGEHMGGRTNPFEDERYAALGRQHAVQNTYVSQFALDALNQPQKLTLSAEEQAELAGIVGKLREMFEKAGLEETAKRIGEQVAELGRDPSKVLHLGFSIMLELFEGLIQVALTLIETIFVELLKLLGQVLEFFRDQLKKPIEIPVISGLYERLSGDALSLLDLACLALAVPATLVYKLLRGGQAPFKASDVETVKNAMSRWGDLRRLIEGPSPQEAAALKQTNDIGPLETVFGICSACILFVGIPVALADDIVAITEGDVPVLPILIVGVSCLGMLFSMPIAVFDRQSANRTTADWYSLGLFMAELTWLFFNIALTGALPTKKATWIPWVGPVLGALAGMVRFVASIVAIVVNIVPRPNVGGILGAVQGLISGFTDVCRIGIPIGKNPKIAWIYIPCLIALVKFGGLATVGLQIASVAIPDEAVDQALYGLHSPVR